MEKLRIKISPEGEISFIYNDVLEGLLHEGEAFVRRASNVEPHPDGGWTAHIIADNVILGPFKFRYEALAKEIEYLERKIFGSKAREEGTENSINDNCSTDLPTICKSA
jgi:hypothetical protein